MIILGLDIATKTGAAFYDTRKPLTRISTETWRLKGEGGEEKAASLTEYLKEALDFTDEPGVQPVGLVMIEEPMRAIKQYKGKINPATVMQLNALAGAAVAVCQSYHTDWRTVPVKTWRKNWFGFGERKGWESHDWKNAAKERAKQLGIKIDSADAAEAIGIAFAGGAYEQGKAA